MPENDRLGVCHGQIRSQTSEPTVPTDTNQRDNSLPLCGNEYR